MYTAYSMKNTQNIKKGIIVALLATSLLTLFNIALQNTILWYTIDIFYFLIPLIFSLTCAKSVKKWNTTCHTTVDTTIPGTCYGFCRVILHTNPIMESHQYIPNTRL